MTAATLQELVDTLAGYDPAAALTFETEAGPIGDGYHITELKRADIASIDCMGRLDAWRETVMQVLDGAEGAPMRLGVFSKIAAKSKTALPDLFNSPLFVEFAPHNQGLGRYRIGEIAVADGRVSVRLAKDRAVCKPAAEVEAGCCG
jgi:hypothetical protein